MRLYHILFLIVFGACRTPQISTVEIASSLIDKNVDWVCLRQKDVEIFKVIFSTKEKISSLSSPMGTFVGEYKIRISLNSGEVIQLIFGNHVFEINGEYYQCNESIDRVLLKYAN